MIAAQLRGREAGLQIDVDAAAAKDLDGGGREFVTDENLGHFETVLGS